jgi:hypothetical protein
LVRQLPEDEALQAARESINSLDHSRAEAAVV